MAKVAKKIKAKPPGSENAAKGAESTVISGQLQKKLSKKTKTRKAPSKQRGVVFLKHLPHGFFEEQLKKYFEQFGRVTRLRLARSKRTGGSKGYAFVEFKYPEVAEIAAETMHNYLMFQRIVKAAYIPPDKQKYNYFKTKVRKVTNRAGKSIYVSGQTHIINKKVKEVNDWNEATYKKRTKGNLKKLAELQKKYADLGIDFESIILNPKSDESTNTSKVEGAAEEPQSSGSILLVKKRKQEENVKSKKQAKSKKSKADEIGLEKLLDKTLEEENSSVDGDFVAESDEEDDEDLSDASIDQLPSDLDFADTSDEDDYGSSDEEDTPAPKKKSAQKVDRLEQIIRRKPEGGIKKAKTLKDKKSHEKADKKTKVTTAKTSKNILKQAAIKEITKATQGKVKPIKKADLKKKTNKKRA